LISLQRGKSSGASCGQVALVWNGRRESGAPFLAGYQQIIERFGLDYTAVDHARVVDEETLAGFYALGGYAQHAFVNRQLLDAAGVVSRLSSTSYMPAADHPRYGAMVEAVQALVAATAERGKVTMLYDTRLYVGRV